MAIAFKWIAPPQRGSPLNHLLLRIQTINFALSLVLLFSQGLLSAVLARSVVWVVDIVAGVAIVISWFRPLFGYGQLGRELTQAAREDERRSWRS
jgi:hypothetical protein